MKVFTKRLLLISSLSFLPFSIFSGSRTFKILEVVLTAATRKAVFGLHHIQDAPHIKFSTEFAQKTGYAIQPTFTMMSVYKNAYAKHPGKHLPAHNQAANAVIRFALDFDARPSRSLHEELTNHEIPFRWKEKTVTSKPYMYK